LLLDAEAVVQAMAADGTWLWTLTVSSAASPGNSMTWSGPGFPYGWGA